jgi:5-(carboxyamino)imidazole ribonucleotide synthase
MNSIQSDKKLILPGSTIGIFGSGQLGKMTTMAAKHMGYRVHIFSPSYDSPAGQVSDLELQAEYTDFAAVESFAKQVDVLTLEFENVPIAALEAASKHTRVSPGAKTLQTTQNRGLEKQFLLDHSIPTCDFRIVRSLGELKTASSELMPAILKTTTDGYDGKGQYVIRQSSDVEQAWAALNTNEAILEQFVEFEFEFSIIAARNTQGEFAAYPTIRNEHRDQILDVSFSPSGLDDEINEAATEIANQIMNSLDTIGVLCVEFFYHDGKILVNEIAPRPHNSGHLTIEAHATSQFEQQVRAVCGLQLGSTKQTTPAAMANLLGDEWADGDPNWEAALQVPNTKLHLYCKGAPQPKRKMGHLVTIADSTNQACEQVQTARKSLGELSTRNVTSPTI